MPDSNEKDASLQAAAVEMSVMLLTERSPNAEQQPNKLFTSIDEHYGALQPSQDIFDPDTFAAQISSPSVPHLERRGRSETAYDEVGMSSRSITPRPSTRYEATSGNNLSVAAMDILPQAELVTTPGPSASRHKKRSRSEKSPETRRAPSPSPTLPSTKRHDAGTPGSARERLAARIASDKRPSELNQAGVRKVHIDGKAVKQLIVLQNAHAEILAYQSLADKPTGFLSLDTVVATDAAVKRLDACLRLVNCKVLEDRRKSAQLQLGRLSAALKPHLSVLPQSTAPVPYSCDHRYYRPIDDADPLAQILAFAGLMLHLMSGISRKYINFLFQMFRFVFASFLTQAQPGMATGQGVKILEGIPSSLDAVLANFNIDGDYVAVAACPVCHKNYQPTSVPGCDKPVYPAICTNIPMEPLDDDWKAPFKPCGTQILDESGEPLRTVLNNTLADWIASLLSDPENERLVEKACADFLAITSNPQSDHVKSPFEATFLRTFRGPDGKTLFLDPGDSDELRMALIMNFDSYVVEGISPRSPKRSIGIISLACLNLPPDIRMKSENMHVVAIIPGPTEPSRSQLSYYQELVMEDLAISYTRGHHISRTASRKEGRVVRTAVVISANDLIAARKSSGNAGASSHVFCHRDNVWNGGSTEHWKKQLGRTDFDHADWQPRDVQIMRRLAEEYRDAPTYARRKEIHDTFGIRWSAYWILPYWNPPLQLVVDGMHCLLGGLVEDQSRRALRLSVTEAEEEPTKAPPLAFAHSFIVVTEKTKEKLGLNTNQVRHITKIQKSLLRSLVNDPSAGSRGKRGQTPNHSSQAGSRAGSLVPSDSGSDITTSASSNVETSTAAELYTMEWLETRLKECSKRALWFVFVDLRLDMPPNEPTKEYMVEKMLEWRASKPIGEARRTKVVTPDVMECIREIIKNTQTPSWISSVPKDFGEPTTGSIKADEWRILFTIYIPLALILMWGEGSSHPDETVRSYARAVLDSTMHLVCAVIIACRRVTSEARARRYREHMKAYVEDIRDGLYPDLSLKPNHHVAFHIYDFLLLFGLMCSWWCFPFERLIGHLQRIPNNHQPGKLESTIHRTFIRTSNLKRWLAQVHPSSIITMFKTRVFDQFFAPKGNTGEFLSEGTLSIASRVAVPHDLRPLLSKSSTVILRAHHRAHTVVFSRASTHVGNSLVQFLPEGSKNTQPIPASIKYIFEKEGKIRFAVQRQLPAPGTVDPFLRYPDFPAKLYSSQLSPSLEEVDVEWVVGHCARYIFSQKLAAIFGQRLAAIIFLSRE